MDGTSRDCRWTPRPLAPGSAVAKSVRRAIARARLRAAIAETARLAIAGNACAGPLHIASAARGEIRRRASAGGYRSDVALLHRLPQIRGLLLERRSARHIVV